MPYWAQGGIGPDTAPAARLAGAAGVVLAEQLWLLQEAGLDAQTRALLARPNGAAAAFEDHGAVGFRRQAASAAPGGGLAMGADTAFAARLRDRHGNVAGVVRAFQQAMDAEDRWRAATELLAGGSPLAASHGTPLPVVQGPMTGISDTPAFCEAVAGQGALAMAALGLMGRRETGELLRRTRDRLGGRPWGVGLLGFAGGEVFREQLAALRHTPPGFAVLAGADPAQAAELESAGIATYLHAPSPGLLRAFLAGGARRLILEGHECGGHVGPCTSFSLWQDAVDAFADAHAGHEDAHVLLAGGIHDALSAAMAATVAAPLHRSGVRVGLLMGSAYLFTREAVETGAISEEYQRQAIRCRRTVILGTGGGHHVRCAHTAYAASFGETKASLRDIGLAGRDLRGALDRLNMARLKLAAKGAEPPTDGRAGPAGGGAPAQRDEGLFMMGQVATLRDRILSIRELHEAVCSGGAALLAGQESATRRGGERARAAAPTRTGEPLAIVGAACIFPDAADVATYWSNILSGRTAFRPVPPERFDAGAYYDGDRRSPDAIYCRHGAFLAPVRFDPLAYGIPPASLPSIEPVQLLAVEVAARAIADAGYAARAFPRDRTAVLFASASGSQMGLAYSFRSMLPHWLGKAGVPEVVRQQVFEAAGGTLPTWTEDSFPGLLNNVISGRVANRLDLGGANFVCDAACASSLSALYAAVHELRSGRCDMAIVGAVDASNDPFVYTCFARTQALTPGDRPHPFDASADGTMLGEGAGAVVLKRLRDAERDGDRIVAVLRGIGASSDGRRRGLTAPDVDGQVAALRRAYADAGIDPSTVELVEAHATGTAVGDASELRALTEVLGAGPSAPRRCAIGSVKSQIGHTKAAAGTAGLIKAALALKHRVLPPTAGVTTPADLAAGALYVNTEPRPWIRSAADHPRRCGLSAFGFGGTNFHAVLEEYEGDYHAGMKLDLMPRGVEILFWARPTQRELAAAIEEVASRLRECPDVGLSRLAAAVAAEEASRVPLTGRGCRLAVIAGSAPELARTLRELASVAGGPDRTVGQGLPAGAFHREGEPLARRGGSQVCFLLPGLAAQRVGMLRDLVVASPWSLGLFEEADAALADLAEPACGPPGGGSRFVFPPPAFTEEQRRSRQAELNEPRLAQPAVGLMDLFALDLLARFGVRPARGGLAGHGTGELVALCAAGCFSRGELLRLLWLRGRLAMEAGASRPGAMAATRADGETVAAALASVGPGAWVASQDAPNHTVIAGDEEPVARAVEVLCNQGFEARRLPVATALHTPLMAGAARQLEAALRKLPIKAPRLPVYSGSTGEPYPSDTHAIAAQLAAQLASPLKFDLQVAALHDAGARLFVECGPGRALTDLVRRALHGREFRAVALEGEEGPAWMGVARLLAEAAVAGLPVRIDRWYEGRASLDKGPQQVIDEALRAEGRPTDWFIDSTGNRPVQAAVEPNRRPGPIAGSAGLRKAAEPDTAAPQAARLSLDEWRAIRREKRELFDRSLALDDRLMSLLVGQGAVEPPAANELPPTDEAPPVPRLPELTPVQGDPPAIAPPASPLWPGVAMPETPAEPGPQAPAEPGPAPTAPTAESFRDDLLRTVSECTGYPQDALGLDVPLESGLGVDSIKILEIFSRLKKYHDGFRRGGEGVEEAMARFGRLNTLRDVIAAYRPASATDAGAAAAPEETPAAMPPAPAPAAADPIRVYRMASRRVASGVVEHAGAINGGAFLVLAGDTPLARSLLQQMADRGLPAVQCIPGATTRSLGAGRFECDLSSPGGPQRGIEVFRELAGVPLGGVLSLLGCGNGAPGRADAGMDEPLRLGGTLLRVLQACETALAPAGPVGSSAPGKRLVNVTRLALDGSGAEDGLLPAGAITPGMFRAVAAEWPHVRVLNVDIDGEMGADLAGRRLAEALLRSDLSGDVALRPDGEAVPDLEALDVPLDPADMPVDRDSVILATGGAYGITAAAAMMLAQAARPHLVLVGRTPWPGEEPPDVRGIADIAALRGALLAKARSSGASVMPADIEREVRAVLRRRLIRRNVAAMRQAGAQVEYRSLDVTDADAFGALIEELYRTRGRIDGVIHGAGIIEDALVSRKAPASFHRVAATKIIPATVLARRLRPAGLRFLLLYSSLAARFGNAGQIDYCGANGYLDRLAARLDGLWPAHVRSIAWGPWDGGMVSDELKRRFREAGLTLIAPEAGARVLRAVLANLAALPPEIVVAGRIDRWLEAGRGHRP